MEWKFLYTFIIPHKNRPVLLQKALESIPHRPDVQIIVVDDNSDPDVVDFEQFPGLKDANTEVIFTHEGKGAGYARNVGLSAAKGKWIVFSDSDDYYIIDVLERMMNDYVDSSADMIVFKQTRVDSNGNVKPCGYDVLFDRAISSGDYTELKYEYYCPIARFIKKSFIDDNNIEFQEVRFSNDVMFILQCGVLARDIVVDNHAIYCVCETDNSLIRNKNWTNPYTRVKVTVDAYEYLKSKGHKEGMKRTAMKCFTWWQNTFYLNKTAAIRLLPSMFACMGLRLFSYFFVWLSSKL